MSDRSSTRRGKFSSIFISLYVLAVLLLSSGGYANAQHSQTIFDGYTPTGVEQGAPAGAYPLSGFENINLFNGSLNVAFPLMHVGGRGTAGYTMTLQTDVHWGIHRLYENPASGFFQDSAEYRVGRGWSVGYSPGFLFGLSVSNSPLESYSCNNGPVLRQYLTRLSFLLPGGTEVLLHDKQFQGAAHERDWCLPGNTTRNRGKVFVSADGESMTFISDADISDTPLTIWEFYPSGYLLMKDGTRYRITNGRVRWIRDRNGNQVSFMYQQTANGEGQVTQITDPLNRVINISYASSVTGYDEISFNGFAQAPRSIKVWYSLLANILRPDSTIKKLNQLFPEVYPSGGIVPGDEYHNPTLVSKIELPDHRAYQLFYNSYGEVARVILPTGGGFDYKHEGQVPNGTGEYQNTYGLIIYRRLTKRTTFNILTPTSSPTAPPAGTREMIENYVVESPFLSPIIVRVEQRNSVDSLLSQSKHHFYGTPLESQVLDCNALSYPWTPSGKEFETGVFKVTNGVAEVTPLRKTEMIWAPPVTGTSAPGCISAPSLNQEIAEIVTTLAESNQVAKRSFTYDQYRNQTDVREYDFGIGSPGALIRHLHTDYLTSNNGKNYVTVNNSNWQPDLNQPSAEKTIHIRNLPTDQVVKDASGTIKAWTKYNYDNYSRSGCNGQNINCDHEELANRVGIFGIYARVDDPETLYDPLTDYYRGNVTSVSRYLLANTGLVQADTPLNSFTQYDIAGNVVAAKDSNNNYTQIGYSSVFQYAYPTSTTSAVPDPSGVHGFSQSLTSATDYDFSSGKVISATDANLKITMFEYNDPLDRLTRVVRPTGGGETVFEYGFGDAAATRFILTKTKQSSNIWIEDYGFYDGLGRSWRSAHLEGGSNYSVRDNQFDALGRVHKVANPYFFSGTVEGLVTGSPSNTNLTVTTFDALSRVTRVTTPDGSHVDTEYLGNKVTVTDQAGKKRSSVTDGLGRLTQVNEAPNEANFNYQTNYTYDILGNLIRVRQGGFPTGGSPDPTVQFRRFYYDSLSRLAYANNPEQDATIDFNPPGESGVKWTMKYEYDANGNLIKRTDARAVETNYGYDALNRNTTVNYSDGTAGVRRYYDVATGGDGGGTFQNGKGRLRRVETLNQNHPISVQPANSRTVIDSYDNLGRITSQKQGFQTGGNWQHFTAGRGYDLASHVTFQSYPASGHNVTYVYGSNGRLSQCFGNLVDQAPTFSYGMVYNPAGQMTEEQFGTSPTPLYHTMRYNNRFQMVETSVGTSNNVNDPNNTFYWDRGRLQFFYNSNSINSGDPMDAGTDNNGNVLRQEHWVPLAGSGHAIPMRDDYSYDPINRLTMVKGYQQPQSGGTFTQIYQQSYAYDKFGNRKLYLNTGDPNNTTWGAGINGTLPSHILEPDKKTNRLMSVTYDSAGNMLREPYGARADIKVYDGENRMTKSQTGSNLGQYVYDGDGRRVRRIVNGVETWQVYGIDGELLAEYNPASGVPMLQKEYGYRNGQLLVVAEVGAPLKWLVADHLGTPRIIVDSTGILSNVRRHDYLPFGEELTVGTGNGSIRTGIGGMGYAADGVRQKFAGKERDIESGLDYLGFRYLSSTQGRFTSVDVIVHPLQSKKGAIWFLNDPQNWNKYSYVLNNPMIFTDPDGAEGGLHYNNGSVQPPTLGPRAGDAFYIPMIGVVAIIALRAPAIVPAVWNWMQRNPATIQHIGNELVQASQGNPASSPASLGVQVERRLAEEGLKATRQELATLIHGIELGFDPAINRLRSAEAQLGLKLESVLGRLSRDLSGRGDWIDKAGRVVDAVGAGLTAQHFNFSQFTGQIVGHLRKVDIVPVDISGLSQAQRQSVIEFVSRLTEQERKRILIVQ